jgi:methyl-accepting chemotaxis protein
MGLRVGGKLLGGFAVVLALTVSVAWAGLSLASSVNEDARRIVEEEVEGLADVASTVAAANEVRRRGLVHVLTADPAEKERVRGEADQFAATVERRADSLERLWQDEPEKLEPLATFRDRWAEYSGQRRKALTLSEAGNFEEARALITGAVGESFRAAEETLDELVQVSESRASERVAGARERFSLGRTMVLLTTALASLLGVTVALTLSRSIAGRLARVGTAAQALAAGDLSRRADVGGRDEVAALAGAFNAMAAQLQEMVESERRAAEAMAAALTEYSTFAARIADGDLTVRLSPNGSSELGALSEDLNGMVVGLGSLSAQVRTSAERIGIAADEILAAVSQVTASATEQPAAISQTSTTAEEIRAASEQVADKARDVAERAQTSVRFSDEGTRAVGSVVEAMQDIRSRVEAMAQDILELSERTQQIGEIIATVDDLADQSNLLALNATIEAAKAGDQGKGFAVVADEVRNLSEQSKQAAAQVRTILKDIQRATDAAVLATEHGTRVVGTGTVLTRQAGDQIEGLAETIRQASQAAQQIMAAAHQQSVGMDQIAQAMTDINQATNQFVAGAEQSESAAEALNELAGQLRDVTGKYKV